MNKAVFLDRDGVLIEDTGYPHKKEDIRILEKVKDVLKQLKDKGFLLIVISNQSSIARGFINEAGIIQIHDYINKQLDNSVDKFYFCPHHPDADLEAYRKICECRKPKPGMILQAAKDWDIDLEQSWMIGDKTSDIVAGNSAGCRTILIENEYSYDRIVGEYDESKIDPNFKVKNLSECIGVIK